MVASATRSAVEPNVTNLANRSRPPGHSSSMTAGPSSPSPGFRSCARAPSDLWPPPLP